MDLTHLFVRNSSIVYREEEDGAFLFDPDTGNLKYMNWSAKEIWLMLNGQRDIKNIFEQLAGLYSDVNIEHIQEDVINFIDELIQNKFILSLDDK